MGGEGGFGRAGSGTGSGRCLDGPASCPRSLSWKVDRISFSRFSTRALKSTNIHRIFAADTASGFFMHWSKIRAFVTTSPGNPKESKNLWETPCHLLLSDSAKACAFSAAAARTSVAAARASAAKACVAATNVCASAASAFRFRSATWVCNRLFSLISPAIQTRSPSISWALGRDRIVGMISSGLIPSSEPICSSAFSIDSY